jgi:hypothetical protein
MAVELAVCIPLVMAVLAIAFNLMVFLGDCARFDRAAAEAVRTRASSPPQELYGLDHSRELIERDLRETFATEGGYLRPSVEARTVASDGSAESQQGGIAFAILPRLEAYECTLEFSPWGFGNTIFGVELSGITHTRTFVIDPFRPGVLL